MRDKRLLLAIVTAGSILAVSVGLKYLVATGTLDEIASNRVMGAMIGIVLAISGNYIPKTLKPMSERQCNSSRWISLRRFAGWAFVIAGSSYSAVWLFAPVELTSVLSRYIVATCVLLVAVPFAWLIISRKRGQPPVGV